MNISEKIKESTVDYEMESVKYITDYIGPREPGSKEERSVNLF